MSVPEEQHELRAQPPLRGSEAAEGARASSDVPPRTEAAQAEPAHADETPAGAGERVGSGELQADAAAESLEERLAAAEARADEHLNDLKRLAAEFENYRKRSLREQERLVARAHERLVTELLPVLDDLGRALEAAEQHEEAKLEEGVRLVHRSLAGVLEREGLEEIPTDGRFDPHVHEALLSQPSEAEEGAIIQVLQKGYRLGDRVLTPARVVVSAGPAAEASAEQEASDGDGD